jgi:AraC-like DNA-binding protein
LKEIVETNTGGASFGIMLWRDARDIASAEVERNRIAERRRRASQRMEPVINHMMQNLNRPLCVSALAALARTSTSHFFVLFKMATGSSPIIFFIRLRMRHACDLLQNRSLTIKQAAVLLGYDDPLYFSRLFKSVNGVSPRAYRKLNPPRPEESADHPLQKNSPSQLPSAPLGAPGRLTNKNGVAHILSNAHRVEHRSPNAVMPQARNIL